jgi:hypothetical protein
MDIPITSDASDYVALSRGQLKFYASEACQLAQEALRELVESPAYDTDSDYFISSSRDFTDRHLDYLSKNPTVNVAGYLSNLKLMTRKQ